MKLVLLKPWRKYNVAIAAEAFAAGVFAHAGYNVLVQYGANQPLFDLMVTNHQKKPQFISVKGSQDGSWGLTQKYLKNKNYHGAIDTWLSRHGDDLIFCLVQFAGKIIGECPDLYLARAIEISHIMKSARNNCGDTNVYVHKTYTKGIAAGTETKIPEIWRFSENRIQELFGEPPSKVLLPGKF